MSNPQKEKPHTPVLVEELLSLFSKKKPPQKMLDCTFGRGGHSLAFLKEFPKTDITGLDCDEQAMEYGSTLKEVREGKIKLLKKNFHHFAKSEGQKETYNMILMDLGVSSPQLDEKERGFSFYQDGPLDMRMDREQELKADNIINSWSKQELVRLFQSYGEIKKPYKVVSAILKQRRKKKFEGTLELAHLIQKHQKAFGRHPATPWFLALRMAVNQELEGLEKCLPDFLPLLKNQGYFALISFHSLEDRIAKRAFRQFVSEERGRLWNKKVIRPTASEKNQNPRSRSAKMRVFQKNTEGF